MVAGRRGGVRCVHGLALDSLAAARPGAREGGVSLGPIALDDAVEALRDHNPLAHLAVGHHPGEWWVCGSCAKAVRTLAGDDAVEARLERARKDQEARR